MNRFSKKEMKQMLDVSDATIGNSRNNPMVMEKVSEFGFEAESMQTGEDLRREAERLYLGKGARMGEKISLSIQLQNQLDENHREFMLYKKLLRRDLRNDPALFREFNLAGPRDYSLMGKIEEPKGFYKICLENKKAAAFVVKYKLTPEKLQEKLDKLAAVETDKTFRAQMVKESEKATEDRDRVFQQLKDWLVNYHEVLIFVFKDDPQQLEAFKIKAYSNGYKPNKKKKNGVEETGATETETEVSEDTGVTVPGEKEEAK